MRDPLTGVIPLSFSCSHHTHEGRWSIAGSGVLITPEGKRIVRDWSYSVDSLHLPGLVRIYLSEIETAALQDKNRMETLTSVRRGLDLQDYLIRVRSELSDVRNRRYMADLNERRRM